MKSWLTEQAQLVAIVALPEDLFAQGAQSKSIFVLQKKTGEGVEPFVYPLTSLRDPEILMEFKEIFKIGVKNMKSSINFDIIVENA